MAPAEHWAFLPIERPELPAGASDTNPIDVLLSARREQHQISVQPTAERSILIRRLYLDLVGLPPTRQQLHDQRPWAEIVDTLLNSPHHGERWGRHWMGRLAVFGLVWSGCPTALQPEALVALARLDCEFAQFRQGLRSNDPRNVGWG